jgi:hypothetical protein
MKKYLTIIAFMKYTIHKKLPVFILIFILIVFVFILATPMAYAGGGGFAQQLFRFRNDNGSESTATWMAATSTNVTNIAKNTNFRIRIKTGYTSSGTLRAQLEYLLASGNSCTSTGWTKITTSTSNAFALTSSANFTDRASTTQQLSSGTFVAGEILQATNPADSSTFSIGDTEDEYNIQATANASDSTAYIFRLSNNGTAYAAGYTVCPQATTSAAVSVPTFHNFIVSLGKSFQFKLGSVFRLQ